MWTGLAIVVGLWVAYNVARFAVVVWRDAWAMYREEQDR